MMKFFKVDFKLPTMGIGNLDFDPEDPDDPVLPAFGSKSRISDVGMTELD